MKIKWWTELLTRSTCITNNALKKIIAIKNEWRRYIHNNLDSDSFNEILHLYLRSIYIQSLQTLNKCTYNLTCKPCNNERIIERYTSTSLYPSCIDSFKHTEIFKKENLFFFFTNFLCLFFLLTMCQDFVDCELNSSVFK